MRRPLRERTTTAVIVKVPEGEQRPARINTFLSLLKERLPQRENNLEVSPYVSSLHCPYCLRVWIHTRFRVFAVTTCVWRKQLLDLSQKIWVRGLILLFTESMTQGKLQNLSICSSGLDQMISKKPSRTKVALLSRSGSSWDVMPKQCKTHFHSQFCSKNRN